MNNFKLVMLSAMLATLSACSGSPKEDAAIGKTDYTPKSDLFDAETLNHLGRLSDPQISPDGKYILYGVTYYSIEENKGNRDLYILNTEDKTIKQITKSAKGEYGAQWYSNDIILFLRDGQLFKKELTTGAEAQISNIEGGIEEYKLSPEKNQILYTQMVKSIQKPADIYPDLDKATGRIINNLMYRHWDHFVEEIPQPFIGDFNLTNITKGINILEGTLFECPTQPFNDISDLCWSPNGKTIAYACKKLTGKEYSLSTNTDIYLYDIAEKTHKNISLGIMGYDTKPLYSPSGSQIVWCSMERDGYESDKNRLMLFSFADGSLKDLTANFKYNIDSAVWKTDESGLYFTSCEEGVYHIFDINLADNSIRRITNIEADFSSPQLFGDKILATYSSFNFPTEVVAVNPKDGALEQITFENKDILDKITMGNVENRRIETTDHKMMQTWIIYPPHFDASKKYPAILFCEGGPQQTISPGWSFRWNMQLMAAHGYIVIAPNRRGTGGFGLEWCEQISGDYAGQNMLDYFSATDAMKKEPFVDENHVGAVGASYGGYSIYYLAGHHQGRFAAFIAHAGIFDTEHMYMETEEMWFPNWDNGGAPWEKEKPIAVKHYSNSPHKAVRNWDTPILITHGELDYRVPVDQAMAAFNAAQLLDVPSQMLLFPDETHWILKPQNNLLWNRMFFEFLDKYLK